MSSGVDLRASRSTRLLESLKQTVSEFASKEEQLSRDLAMRRSKLNQKYRHEKETIEVRFSTLISDTESYFKSEEKRITAIYEGRRPLIERLHSAALRNLPKRVNAARGEWLGNLQLRQFHAERAHAAGMHEADSHVAETSATLAAQRAVLRQIERRAKKAFSGYLSFLRLLRGAHKSEPGREASAAEATAENLETRLQNLEARISAFERIPVPRIFRFVPLPVAIGIVFLAVVVVFLQRAAGIASIGVACGGALFAGLLFLLHRKGFAQSRSSAAAIADDFAEAFRILRATESIAASRSESQRQRTQEAFDATSSAINEQWTRVGEVESEFGRAAREKIEQQVLRLSAKIDELMRPKLERLETECHSRVEQFKRDAELEKRLLEEKHEAELVAMNADETARWAAIADAWKREIVPIYRDIEEINATASARFPAWDAQFAGAWTPPSEFAGHTRFAHLDLDLTKNNTAIPKAAALALPGSPQVSVPLTLTYPDHGSLLFETRESGGAIVIGALNNILLRLFSTTPPGKLACTIIDPVGLGENFAGLMHLADYEESLINRRIWTQREQIEERLGELSEHIEKVIQMYLRNEYATITEYNEKAGSVAEKYHFLVVADFPANFSETAAKRLQSIASSGPRCGIFTLIHWDQRQPLPDGFVPDELRKNSICIRLQKGVFTIDQSPIGAELVFDSPPEPDLAVALVHKIGRSSIDSNRVEVPFSQIAPKPGELWTNDTTNELKIAVGRTGATKLQYLAIGKGTRQHALFAGKTGSGKSTLFHVIITNLALACSPDQVEFYLIDFKKGVEFKCYATKRLPHARVVAIESDREFALSVLQRVDEELKRRGDLFRKLGVQDLAGYKKAGGAEPMPRSLLLIDEFQEFFVEDDSIAQTASLLFDRIVRQGRAFGIHVLLGSQTLGGAYSLARATLGQMVIRVALQCNEADAYLIMDDGNSAPRLLSRPGEGIYNDAAGAIEGNSPFQVVWLPDDERDQWLEKVRALADARHDRHSGPIVFEGNAPADIRENELLAALLEDQSEIRNPKSAIAWLGAPNSIKGPTEAVFHRQSGNHLLIVGQREEAALSMMGLSLIALAAQHPAGTAKFFLLHNANPGSPDADFIAQIATVLPDRLTVARSHDVAEVMNKIAAELKSRSAAETQPEEAPSVFLFIHGLHKFKKLRHEDDFSFSSEPDGAGNPGVQLNDLICEGSSLGLHIIATIDTFNNVNRSMSRKALSEFEMRVVFQMSANDSASLIDSPKASTLGLHRALFYNEHEGTLETFRPYALPDPEWLRETAEALARRSAQPPRTDAERTPLKSR